MEFAAAKLLGWLTKPSNALLLLVAVAALLPAGRGRLARLLRALPLALLLVVGLLPVGQWALRPLEERFARPAQPPPRVDGVIVLGGSTVQAVGAWRDEVTTNEAAERLHQGLRLALRYPDARLVHSGGSGELDWAPGAPTEAEAVRRWFAEAGLPADRLETEARSRTTRENALFSQELLAPAPGEVWLLVTSAAHMPRSVGLFRQLGFPVVPWPADWRTGPPVLLSPHRYVSHNLTDLDTAAHEWIGLIYYRLRGWTDALLPRPEP
jgi:uncharacterized SAM-binding protein YcdF (DUF218 family)